MAGYQSQPPALKATGYSRLLLWGHAKLRSRSGIQAPGFSVDKVSQQSLLGLFHFQNSTFSKSPMDDGPCLASTLSLAITPQLCVLDG